MKRGAFLGKAPFFCACALGRPIFKDRESKSLSFWERWHAKRDGEGLVLHPLPVILSEAQKCCYTRAVK